MFRGLYTGSSGMMVQMLKMNTIANNLANVDSSGYKRDSAISKAFPELLLHRINDDGKYVFPMGSADTSPVVGKLGTGVELNEIYTAFTQATLKETGNDFDLALQGKGFFVIQTPYGERYTRNGSFILGKEGALLTKEGYPVLGEKGPLHIKKNNFLVDEQGRIFQDSALAADPKRLVSKQENDFRNIELLDTLRVVDFQRTRYLKKQGSSFWMSTEESGKPFTTKLGDATKVRQGFLEGSNVNPVVEMTKMIEVNRIYEANQKAIQSQDSMTARLLNDVAKV